MGIADFVIIAIVGILFGLAVAKAIKNKGGCNCSKGGNCSSCTGSRKSNCNCNK